jgi:hypothetical protein
MEEGMRFGQEKTLPEAAVDLTQTLFNGGVKINRRQLLQAGALLSIALMLAGCQDGTKLIIPPTPTPARDAYPKPILQNKYEQMSAAEKIISLLRGHLPESWANLEPVKLIEKIKAEAETVLLPQIAWIFNVKAAASSDYFHLVYSKQEMANLLVARGRYSNEEAEKMAAESAGLTIYRFNNDLGRSTTDKFIVIQAEDAVNIWDDAQRNYIREYPNVPAFADRAFLNSKITAALWDTIIHEAVHFFLEQYVRINDAENTRLVDMYAGKITVNGESINIKNFIYAFGAMLNGKTEGGNSYLINKQLLEIYRAYFQLYVLKLLSQEKNQDAEGMIHDLNVIDTVGVILLENLHKTLDVSSEDVLKAYRDSNKGALLALVDLYKAKARSKGISLEDRDLAAIFIQIEAAKNELEKKFDDKKFSLNSVNEIADKYWKLIFAILAFRKKGLNYDEKDKWNAQAVLYPSSDSMILC